MNVLNLQFTEPALALLRLYQGVQYGIRLGCETVAGEPALSMTSIKNAEDIQSTDIEVHAGSNPRIFVASDSAAHFYDRTISRLPLGGRLYFAQEELLAPAVA